MDLNQRVREVRSHIDNLQLIANKHKENGKKRCFNFTCEVIKDNKLILKVLREDLKKHNKIISSRIQHE